MAETEKTIARFEFDITSITFENTKTTGDTGPITIIHTDDSRITTRAGKWEISHRLSDSSFNDRNILNFPAFGLGRIANISGHDTENTAWNLHFDVLRGNPLNRIETVHWHRSTGEDRTFRGTVQSRLVRNSDLFNETDAYWFKHQYTARSRASTGTNITQLIQDLRDHIRMVNAGFKNKISIAGNFITDTNHVHTIEETLLTPAIIPTTDDLDTELLTLWGVLYADHYEIPEPDAGEAQSITTTEPMATTNLWSLL